MVDRRNVSLNQKAASAVVAVAAKQVEVMSRLAVERGVARTGGRVQSNSFRCPKCQRVRMSSSSAIFWPYLFLPACC